MELHLLVLLTSNNKIIRIGVDEIRTIGRVAIGVHLVNLDEGAQLVAFDRIKDNSQNLQTVMSEEKPSTFGQTSGGSASQNSSTLKDGQVFESQEVPAREADPKLEETVSENREVGQTSEVSDLEVSEQNLPNPNEDSLTYLKVESKEQNLEETGQENLSKDEPESKNDES